MMFILTKSASVPRQTSASPMPVAALYDIHGNLPALEAVLEEICCEGVDHVLVGGDVLPGPMPCECLDLLTGLEIPTQFIMGNGDRETLAQMRGIETEWYRKAPPYWRDPIDWTAQQLLPKHEKLIAGWPATLPLHVDGLGDVLFCHATPRNDKEIFTRLTAEERLRPAFASVTAGLVVCGHTHMQFDRRVGKTRVVNAGSVGMPFGRTGADWLLLGPEMQLRHTDYDRERAAQRIRQISYPQTDDFVERYVLRAPPEAEVLASFSKAELR
jgi:predicted phosphodiesterase